jgi:hypothetical protein
LGGEDDIGVRRVLPRRIWLVGGERGHAAAAELRRIIQFGAEIDALGGRSADSCIIARVSRGG